MWLVISITLMHLWLSDLWVVTHTMYNCLQVYQIIRLKQVDFLRYLINKYCSVIYLTEVNSKYSMSSINDFVNYLECSHFSVRTKWYLKYVFPSNKHSLDLEMTSNGIRHRLPNSEVFLLRQILKFKIRKPPRKRSSKYTRHFCAPTFKIGLTWQAQKREFQAHFPSSYITQLTLNSHHVSRFSLKLRH